MWRPVWFFYLRRSRRRRRRQKDNSVYKFANGKHVTKMVYIVLGKIYF